MRSSMLSISINIVTIVTIISNSYLLLLSIISYYLLIFGPQAP